MFPLILLGLVYGAWRWYENTVPGILTPERKAIYMTAMHHERDPVKLEYWAKWYEQNGFPTYAGNLRKRIQIPAVHGAERAQRQTIVRRAFSSENPYAIREVAEQFLNSGYGATYQELYDYANGLEVDQSLDSDQYGNDYGAGAMRHQRWDPHFGYCNPIPYGTTPPMPPNCPPFGYPPPVHDAPPEPADMVPRFGEDGTVTYSLSGNDIVLSPDSEAAFAIDPKVALHVQKVASDRAQKTGQPVAVWSNNMQNQLLSVQA
jgi:hypothetical protein